jgi:membrane protease YdiL (CAAX protease family)
MKGFRDSIEAHPVLAYVILTYSISWTVWFTSPILAGNEKVLFSILDTLGAFGPAISALILSGIKNPQKTQHESKKRVILFLIVFCGVFGLFYWGYHDNQPLILVLLTLQALISAYVVSAIYHPRQGVSEVMAGMKKPLYVKSWFWFAVLFPFVMVILAYAISVPFQSSSMTASAVIISLEEIAVTYPATFFGGGPLCEEPGWRGYLVPHVQKRWNPLLAGIFTGIIWTVWHFPLHMTPFYGDGLSGFLFRFVYNVPLGILFVWLYNRTNGNLLLCMLLHCSINVASGLFGPLPALIDLILIDAFVAVIIFASKMWKTNATENSPTNFENEV